MSEKKISESLSPQDEITELTTDFLNLRYAIDQSAIVAITDPAGVIIYVNDKFCEISGYSREELLGSTHQVVNSRYHPPEFFADLWRCISGGNNWFGEIRNRAKNGRDYWVSTSIVPMLDHNKKIKSYVSIRFDITSRKEAEEQLKTYAAELERSNKELENFASIAAHDLQEPLRKIQAFASRLGQSDLDSDKSKDYLIRMEKAAARMQKLINDLLSYSRISMSTRAFHPVDLNHVVREVLSDLEFVIEEKKAIITVDELPVIEGDEVQLKQLMQNLIGNALKFHKPQNVPQISIQSQVVANNAVLLEFPKQTPVLRLTVQDQGIGFDQKYQERIFTIFQRLHGRTEYEGTGIGLAICRRIVERHHAVIEARGELNHGASFVVTLPLKQKRESQYE